MDEIVRIWIEDDDDRNTAASVLDEAMIDYDYDSGDRIMINDDDVDEAEQVLTEAGIDYDII